MINSVYKLKIASFRHRKSKHVLWNIIGTSIAVYRYMNRFRASNSTIATTSTVGNSNLPVVSEFFSFFFFFFFLSMSFFFFILELVIFS